MTPYTYIQNNQDMKSFMDDLKSRGNPTLAIDFEGEYNLHEYGEKLCLIQIYDKKNYYLIDPVKIQPRLLKDFLENARIIKLFYGAESDFQLVFRQYGIQMKSVMDLKLLVQALDLPKQGLDIVQQEILGIAPYPQKKKFQRYNWTRRPLQEEALEYALSDVTHLFQLHQTLLQRLEENHLFPRALQEMACRNIKFDPNPAPGYKKKNEYKRMKPRQQSLFDKIYEVRDHFAQQLNWPPNNVIPNTELYHMAQAESTSGFRPKGAIPQSIAKELEKRIDQLS